MWSYILASLECVGYSKPQLILFFDKKKSKLLLLQSYSYKRMQNGGFTEKSFRRRKRRYFILPLQIPDFFFFYSWGLSTVSVLEIFILMDTMCYQHINKSTSGLSNQVIITLGMTCTYVITCTFHCPSRIQQKKIEQFCTLK